MPKLKLNKWMLRADRHNWILYQMKMPNKPGNRKKDKEQPPEPYEDIYGFYSSLPQALVALIDLSLRESEFNGELSDFSEELKKVIAEVRQLYEVLLK